MNDLEVQNLQVVSYSLVEIKKRSYLKCQITPLLITCFLKINVYLVIAKR
jgi:hypothetical protein